MFIIFAIGSKVMPRNKYKRIIGALPEIDGFLPMGVDAGRAEKIELHVEEYEVIRLLDYLGYTQDEHLKRCWYRDRR